MRKIFLTLFFLIPIISVFFFINGAFTRGNVGFSIDKTQKGFLVSKITAPINAVEENDLIVSADGIPYSEFLGAFLIRPQAKAPGTLTVLRKGKTRHLELNTIPFTLFSLLALIWPRLMLITVFLTLGTLVIQKDGQDRLCTLFFLMLCSFSTALSATIPSSIAFIDPMTYSISFLLHTPFNWIAFGLWLHFALRFPEERDMVRQRWWIPAGIYALPAITVIGGAWYAAGFTSEYFTWVQRLRNIYLPLIIIGVFAKHVIDYRALKNQQERNRIKLPMIAYWLTFAPYLFFYLLPNIIIDTPLISFRIAVFAFFILPLAYYAGILRYKLFNVDQIISRTIAYFAIIILLSIIYSLFFAALKKWFFGDAILSKEIFLIFLILMNIVFHPVILKLDHLIRHLFFKNHAISLKVMHDFSDRITTTLELNRIIHAVTRELPPAIHVTSAALMILETDRSRLFPEHLGLGKAPWPQSRLVRLFKNQSVSYLDMYQPAPDPDIEKEIKVIKENGFSLILPLRTATSLSGLLFIGSKASGALFSESDILLLGSFANQATIALENSTRHESLIKGKKQLEQMFDQKVQAEKMAVIGEMTSVLAHELKNPLSIIHSSAQYLAQGEPSKKLAREMIFYILNEVDHLNLSINSILNLARQKPPEFSKVDLEKEIQRLLDQWTRGNDHKKEIEIHLEIPHPLPPVYADFRQLAQVLLNLVRNSEEMMADGGEIRLFLDQDRDEITIWITDTGPGIPEENLTLVFDNFFTTKKQGLGLGLAACRQIVHAHNGSITLENRTDEDRPGALAKIRLPREPFNNIADHELSRIAVHT